MFFHCKRKCKKILRNDHVARRRNYDKKVFPKEQHIDYRTEDVHYNKQANTQHYRRILVTENESKAYTYWMIWQLSHQIIVLFSINLDCMVPPSLRIKWMFPGFGQVECWYITFQRVNSKRILSYWRPMFQEGKLQTCILI